MMIVTMMMTKLHKNQYLQYEVSAPIFIFRGDFTVEAFTLCISRSCTTFRGSCKAADQLQKPFEEANKNGTKPEKTLSYYLLNSLLLKLIFQS